MKYGTYPKVLLTGDADRKQEILIELADAYLYKDVLEFHGIRKAINGRKRSAERV